MISYAEQILLATDKLIEELKPLHFHSPVTHTYNPLIYARKSYETYIKRFANTPKRVLYLGMNPGPYGMAQTGIPFGEITAVKQWLGINCPVGKPQNEHPKRPISGFDCPRSEVSGRRLWGLFASLYPNAAAFFTESFVANYCPLVWMSETGSNIPPDKLPLSERIPVEAACQRYLIATIKVLNPEILIGIGAYAQKQLQRAAKELPNYHFTIGTILHPSPASPLANKQWDSLPQKQLAALNIPQ